MGLEAPPPPHPQGGVSVTRKKRAVFPRETAGKDLSTYPVPTAEQQTRDAAFREKILKHHGAAVVAFIPSKVFLTKDYGKFVFQLSNKTVLKIVTGNRINVTYEALMQYKFALVALGPPILKYALWELGTGDVTMAIIMDSVTDIIPAYLSTERSEAEINTYVTHVEAYLKRMCAEGLRHLDAHWNNFGHRENRNPITIDFGYSTAGNDPASCKFELELAQMGRTLSEKMAEGKAMHPVSRQRLFAAVREMHIRLRKEYEIDGDVPETPKGYQDLWKKFKPTRPTLDMKKRYVEEHSADLRTLETLPETMN